MQQRFAFARVAHLLLILLLAVTGSSSAQTATELFDDRVLHSLHIAIHSRDWGLLHANYRENDYYPADVTWNGIRVQNVGVRSRGNGSRSPFKPGLKLDFTRYSARGQFLGLRSLVLDNLHTDGSMIRERVSMAFLRRFGVAAPREAYAKVFVNGQYAGLYLMVEAVDEMFVQRTLGDGHGALFEFRWVRPFHAEYPGDDLDLYRSLFEPRSRQNDSIFDLYDPIRELFRAINETPGARFRDAVGALLDLDATVRLIAAEIVLVEVDGILGFAGMNNFYLYRHVTTRQHQFFPWDKDYTLLQWDYPLLTGADENALMRRVLEDPELRALYLSRVLEAVDAATDADWLEHEIQKAYGQIRDAAHADPVKPFTNDEFEQTVAELIDFARRRPSFVVQEVQRYQRPGK
jgi:spore coat protein H